jgi:hypothetical protein
LSAAVFGAGGFGGFFGSQPAKADAAITAAQSMRFMPTSKLSRRKRAGAPAAKNATTVTAGRG